MSAFRLISMSILTLIIGLKNPGSMENLVCLIGLFVIGELFEIKKSIEVKKHDKKNS